MSHLANEQINQLMLDAIDPSAEEVVAMAKEIQRWRMLYLDQPEDRLYHAKDNTWWRRDDTFNTGIGSLVSADPPGIVQDLIDLVQDLINAADS